MAFQGTKSVGTYIFEALSNMQLIVPTPVDDELVHGYVGRLGVDAHANLTHMLALK